MPASPTPPTKSLKSRPTPTRVARALEPWFLGFARPFPWRPLPIGKARDPWRSLVSELMLQQTQAARVAERFEGFMDRFPTAGAMARAEEAEVLAEWAGLGFYRRARLLHAAACAIVDRHGGRVPEGQEQLLALPGVGRYTAGAVASMVFNRREPIVDGNVSRVLLRVHGKDGAAGEPDTDRWVSAQAGELVEASESPAVLNESLMELGANLCTPKAAKCERCPLSGICRAHNDGTVGQIPRPKKRARVTRVWAAMVVHAVPRSGVLLEQRGATGMWSNMWQLPTLESDEREPTAQEVLGFARADEVEWVESFTHTTTHREIEFSVWAAKGMRASKARVRVDAERLCGLGVSNPQRRVIRRALDCA